MKRKDALDNSAARNDGQRWARAYSLHQDPSDPYQFVIPKWVSIRTPEGIEFLARKFDIPQLTDQFSQEILDRLDCEYNWLPDIFLQ